MGMLNNIAPPSAPQERKHRRFSLQYPVRLKVQSSDLIAEFKAMTRNISACGLLLKTSSLIPQYTPVSFIVTVDASNLGHPIRFVGNGKVVRVQPARHGFAIAVECTRPINQITGYLQPGG